MQICHHYKDASVEWAVCRFEESFPELSALCDDASLVEYALGHFSNEKRRCEWLAARILVKKLLGSCAEVGYSADGKPRLLDGSRYISISHTTGYVAVALHTECCVGVDVEAVGTKVLGLCKRFLSAEEIDTIDKNNELTAILLHWSAKESFYKIVGNKGGSFAENFMVTPFVVGQSGDFFISYTYKGVLVKKLRVNYFVEKDYVFTLCVDDK